MRATTSTPATRCGSCRNPLPANADGSPLRNPYDGPGRWCPVCGAVSMPRLMVTLGCGHTAEHGSRSDYLDRCPLCAAVAGCEKEATA